MKSAGVMKKSCWMHPVVAFALFASLMGIFSGCSNTPLGGGKSEILTDSDEPEGRKRARIRLELAVGYYNNGQTTVALDELKQSINADPSLFEAYNLRGLIFMRLNDMAVAEESFRRAMAINPAAATVQHNYGWMLCQQGRYGESYQQFRGAIANPAYAERAKTLMTLGMCQLKEGQKIEAEASLLRSYELDAGNPITGYNLALLFFERKDYVRAQFYVRRINNSELANAESLWLGIRIERQMNSKDGMTQLGAQLSKRFPKSVEAAAYERGAFND